jgi:GWxTD domain-containing protein
MKNVICIVLLSLIVSVSHAELTAYFSCCTFDQPGVSPYVETYLDVDGSTAKLLLNDAGKLQGKIEVQWIFKKEDSIVNVNKYNMLSPEIDPRSSDRIDFIDQQRVQLPYGEYDLELSIRDVNNDGKALQMKHHVKMDFPENEVSISDIEQLQSFTTSQTENKFTKSGYDLLPYVNAFYPNELEVIKFYAEIYKTDEVVGENYLVRYYISRKDNHRLVENLIGQVKQSPAKVNVVLAELPVSSLPSGNYNLNIEILNKENKLLAFKQTFFQRSNIKTNPVVASDINSVEVTNSFVANITNPDSLTYYIDCLYPISSSVEEQIAENQMNSRDVPSMQKYFLYFWEKRNPANPQESWLTYKAEVEKVNASFATQIKKGYETERGRVYLQYGPPNALIHEDHDPDTYPYEIWQYYKTEEQTNRKFVFYANEGSSNDYKLLHSDAKGELQEPNWELKLHSRSQQFGNDLDQKNSIDSYGSRTKENFANPK